MVLEPRAAASSDDRTSTCLRTHLTRVGFDRSRAQHPHPGVARLLGQVLVANGRRLAGFFLGFAALGYLLIEVIPTQVLTSYLGADSWWSVPLAATLGIPIYLKVTPRCRWWLR